jgi:cytoskeletal protein RodZ
VDTNNYLNRSRFCYTETVMAEERQQPKKKPKLLNLHLSRKTLLVAVLAIVVLGAIVAIVIRYTSKTVTEDMPVSQEEIKAQLESKSSSSDKKTKQQPVFTKTDNGKTSVAPTDTPRPSQSPPSPSTDLTKSAEQQQ